MGLVVGLKRLVIGGSRWCASTLMLGQNLLVA